MYKCQECGRKFRTTKAAEKASFDGCPGCGGVDIDIDPEARPTVRRREARPPVSGYQRGTDMEGRMPY
jgi:predicted  nucleic acid-binding Zn-ribbon protein